MAEPAPMSDKAEPRFVERPTQLLVPDAWKLGAVPLAAAALFALASLPVAAGVCLALALFVGFFFRNPQRLLPGDELCVVAPADGRVLEVREEEAEGGAKQLRIAIFLSIFDVHVNRAPLAGRVVEIERGGTDFLAAFDPRVLERNVRLTLTLENEAGLRFQVTQITGLIARRIVCHAQVGEWLRRGDRYGLIRFGSRTDVVLPTDAQVLVMKGDRVRGGQTLIARLPETLA